MLFLQVYEFIMKPFCSAEWWTIISWWSKFHFQIFLLPEPKVSIFSVSEYQCSPLCKVWWSKANNHWKVTYSNLGLFLSKIHKQHSTRELQFSFQEMFNNVNQSSQSTDCAAENSKPQFMSSLGNAILNEASKSKLLLEGRPIGSSAIKMLCDLLLSASGLWQHVVAMNVRAKVRAPMHNWSIWFQG